MTTSREEGVTLLEVSITVMLLGIVLAMLVQVMITVQTSVELEVARSDRNDRLRLAVRAIERQIRSGIVVADPASDDDAANGIVPGMSVRVLTEPTPSAARGSRCAQWRIDDGRIETREWSPGWRVDADVTDWRLIADGIVNRDVSPTVAAFTQAGAAAYGGRVLEVRLLARPDSSESTVQRAETSVSGRNTGFGAAISTCDDIPPYS
jgi:hypothetical protein